MKLAGLAILLVAAAAHADDRPPIRLELDARLDAARDDIQRAVRVEVGDDDADPRSVAVRVACAAAGGDAGVVLELGLVAAGATARDLGEPAAALGGWWAALGVSATIAL